ncbi:MAG: hypothetical protein JWN96_294 [Mycobacterium sp.]|nr:hypothetical protein [Mycobacterium sp.]
MLGESMTVMTKDGVPHTVTIQCDYAHASAITDLIDAQQLHIGVMTTTVGVPTSTIEFTTTHPDAVLSLGLIKMVGARVTIALTDPQTASDLED